MSKKLIAVVGPTGSGKTALAVALAKKFNGVLISADSRQVYRGLDIGTNKEGQAGDWQGMPARSVEGIPQLLIDVVAPGKRFTLNDWLEQAKLALERVWSAGQLPIIVGGTGLYVTALLEGYQPGGGRFAKNNQPVNFQALILQPDVDREILNQKSDQRLLHIFDALVNETQELVKGGVDGEWLKKIGLDYRYAFMEISGEFSRAEIITQFQQASRQYIRRQLTWWRHHGDPVLAKSADEATQKVQEFLFK